MRRILKIMFPIMLLMLLHTPVSAAGTTGALPDAFDMDEQLNVLGKDELVEQVPENAKKLMDEAGVDDLKAEKLLQLSPRNFFRVLWRMLLDQLKKPLNVLAAVVGVVLLCALIGGMRDAAGDSAAEPVFSTVSVLCVITAVSAPIVDCIVETSEAIRQASTFMLSFIPMFGAALTAAGQPITGATYNVFLFSACQAVSQVVAGTLIPLMGVYLALCIVGPLSPGLNMSGAAATLKSLVSWALGLIVTMFVGLLSVQTLVSQSADSVSTRTAKFLIGSFVPVVGNALSEAFVTARGCLQLLKTTVGAYGILVAVMTFLPVMLQTAAWYMITNVAVMASDVLGTPRVSEILKSCGSVLGILLAIILCYALLLVVSTTVVILTGMGAAA